MRLVKIQQLQKCWRCQPNRESMVKRLLQKITVKPRAISFCLSPNKTLPSPQYPVGSKRKVAPEEKSKEKLPEGIGDPSSYSLLVIDNDLSMGNMSGWDCSIKNHTPSKQYCYSNDGDVISGFFQKTATPSTDVKIQVRLIILMMMFKRLMVI